MTTETKQKPLTETPFVDWPHGDATYDPDDNKLRMRAAHRLSTEDYARAKSAGFRWAPKQEVFYAVWSPAAEDLLTEWCGEIGDEDTTLAERAEERADRFADYSTKREIDGDAAQSAVRSITDGIPLGQPILVGHHSERRARKDQQRIESNMAKAVKMWETAEYWQRRAAGAVQAADYKNQPAVRARRIKTIEAERRKRVASYTPHGPEFMQEPHNQCWREEHHPEGEQCIRCAPCLHVLAGSKGIGAWPVPVRALPGLEKAQARRIAHLDRRLAYEIALLGEQGATKLLEKPKRPKQPPILNYRAPSGQLKVWQRYGDSAELLDQQDMTKAEYQAVYHDSRWTVLSEDKSHRVRFACPGGFRGPRVAVFLTDSKEHPKP